MYTEEEIDLITLSSLPELSYGLKNAVLSDDCLDFSKYDSTLIKTLPRGVYNKVKGKFSDGSYRAEILKNLAQKGVTCVTYLSENYPEELKNISIPPIVLYCKGDISLLKSNCFAVVGSRKSSPKTVAECRKISGELAEAFTIVSGTAEGADRAALEGALEKGRVISVLPSGFDRIYPATNANFINRIESGNLIVTEYTPETQARKYFFHYRNRIIAGLSRGTLVVSAGTKSGALITANCAAEYGRDVFAFPYSLGCAEGAGCNSLIKNGAYLVENILDIFQVYGLDFKSPEAKPLTEGERALLEEIKSLREAFVPQLAAKLGKQPYQIIPLLASLEIKGYIASLGGNRYAVI